MSGNAGPPMLPGVYNNNMQLFQTPDHVAVMNEMMHTVRVIPLDGRPARPAESASTSATRAAAGRATPWWSRP